MAIWVVENSREGKLREIMLKVFIFNQKQKRINLILAHLKDLANTYKLDIVYENPFLISSPDIVHSLGLCLSCFQPAEACKEK